MERQSSITEWGEILTGQNASPAVCASHSMPHGLAAANSQPSPCCLSSQSHCNWRQRGEWRNDGFILALLGNVERWVSVSLVSTWESPLALSITTLPKPYAYSELTPQSLSCWTIFHYYKHAQPPMNVQISVLPVIRICVSIPLISQDPHSILYSTW